MKKSRSKGSMVCSSMLAIGLGVAAMAPTAFSDSAKGIYEETVERQLPFNPGATLSLEGRNGKVEVRVWDRDEIKIIGTKQMRIERASTWLARLIGLRVPDVETDEEAREYFEKFTMEISGDADGLEVKTSRPPSAGQLDFSMSYEIILPRKSNMSVEMSNGRLEIAGVNGRVDARSVNGRITCNEINGALLVRTVNGRLDLQQITGSIDAQTVNGRISATLAAPLPSDGEIICRTTNGGIRLGVPRDANFELKIQSRSSRVSSDFESIRLTEDRPKRLEGIVGDGGPLISLRTVNGPVELEAL